MRLNIKNPETKVHMYEKKSNTVSIVIAIAAVLLIFGGVYLINQSFSKTNSTAKKEETKTSTQSTVTKAKDTTPSTDIDKSTTVTTSTSNTSNKAADNSSAATTTTDTTEPTTDKKPTDTVDPATTTSTLAEDQAIVRVSKVTPLGSVNRYDIEVVDTGFKDGAKLKKGAKTFINVSGVTLIEGKTYQISSITEKDGKISISSLQAKEVSV
jgi:hypothetical protein